MASYLASRSAMLGFGVVDLVPGSAQRSTSFVDIPRSVVAELALLSAVLDSSSDISVIFSDLVGELTRSLPSFIGLSILVGDRETQVEVTTIEDAVEASRIRTSLRFPLLGKEPPGGPGDPSGVFIVYAGMRGALVDLAADLTWLTGRPLSDARLDEDLGGPTATALEGSLSRLSMVNQAVGVLIGGGLTADQASAELDARVAGSGIERHLVAAEILDCLTGPQEGHLAGDS